MKLQSLYKKLRSTLGVALGLLTIASGLGCLPAFSQTPAEPEPLIKEITAPNWLGKDEGKSDFAPGKLIDGDQYSRYHTPDDDPNKDLGEQYLEVTLHNPLDLKADEDIIVFLQRCHDCDNRQPTVFRVEGLNEDGNWEHFCYVYFLFRGKHTKEYSARLHTDKKYSKLKFYVTANNTRSYGKDGYHSMAMAEFQIYKVKRDGYYPSPMADQFHLRDDYNRAYEDYTFVKTMGWLDARNRSEANTKENRPAWEDGNINNEAWAKGDSVTQKANIAKLANWAKWDKDWSKEGTWLLDEDELFELGIQMPEMTPIKNDSDFDPAAKMQVQPTHVTEHILYALPGDPIILTPYGNFAEAKHFEKYEVNFAHWYDYRTGDRIEVEDEKTGVKTNLLDFLADPWGVCTSKGNGFYGAYLMAEKKDENGNIRLPGLMAQNYGMSATFFCPRDPFIETGTAHSLPFRDIDKKKNSNDVDEFIIAADFSQSFNKGRNLNTTSKEIIEPNIAFRHIFRIRDGKTFAEEFSGSVENNKKYVTSNRRDITARAGKPFQIGLDAAVPEPFDVDKRWRSVPSDIYYKISDTDYRRINAMRLKITHPDGTVENLSNQDSRNGDKTFYFGESYVALGARDIDKIRYRIGIANNADGDWGKYLRMLKSDKSLSGKYKVEIIGQEIIGEKEPRDINICGTTTPLVVMEFDIDFADNEDAATPKAILVSTDRLHSDDKFKFAREEEMVKKYGKAKDRIDFDYYRGLESLANAKEYLDNRVEGSKHYQFRWPAAWNKSQYANGYSNDHNYNMYVVANHTSRTPYHNFWHHNDDHKDAETMGLYDRLHDKTTRLHAKDASVKEENGYFLYVNAASDPGVMVNLKVDNLCTGSTVHVSAWVAELSKEEEMANLVFNFVAVLANGDRVNLHSFVSGYIPRNIGDYNNPSVNTHDGGPGQWMNVNYSFNPDVTRFSASQVDHYELELENNCKSSSGADYAVDDISIYIMSPVVNAEQVSPLCLDAQQGQDNLVRIETPFTETLQSIDVPEVKGDVNGETVKLQYVVLDREKFDKAYAAAEKANSDNPGLAAYTAEGVKIGEGTVTFNSNPSKNPKYDPEKLNEGSLLQDERDVNMLAFNSNFKDSTFRVGKEYYISLYIAKESEAKVADWTTFDITDPCAKYCLFKVKSKNTLLVDGEIREQDGEISVCEGESPEVSINVATKEGSKEYLAAECDWFLGTRDEYDAIEKGELSLYKAMTWFREKYPKAKSPEEVEAQDEFTEEMRQYIIENADKIRFLQKSYKFPAIMIPEGEDEAEDVVLVLPIPNHDDNLTVCTAPMEIRIHADLHAPKLLHGLQSGITYPETMGNAPLRIGLGQIKSVTVEKSSTVTEETPLLIVPIRSVQTSGVVSNVKSMRRKSDVILLESTTDPNYDLEYKPVVSESGVVYMVRPEYEAGRIYSFKAVIDGTENNLGAVFNKDFTFREGYEYTLSYRFREAVGAQDADVKLCDGRTFFTVKVVPEYMVWTGSEENRNWNNDANWQRVDYSDINADKNDADVAARLTENMTDGSNNNTSSFVPMDFTKVIIPGDADSPYLYEFKGAGEEAGTMVPAEAGAATEEIEYDMVANDVETGVNCGLWYANTCGEIHFRPSATIMNQQWLSYGKAWVDLEIDPYRWYTLAMPLQKVFAGEFYLPSADGRQATELFQPISFDESLNHRFKPAVFQRGWDKSSATTYCPDGSTATAVIKANWSHVYNDVEESYGSGTGFSIKVDMTAVNEAKATAPDEEAEQQKVLFRLPKADTYYDYYDAEGNVLVSDHRKTIDHGDAHYRLNPASGEIEAVNAGEGEEDYFLVGNPFMTYMDMGAFLDANSGVVEKKYWLVSSGSQKAAVFDESADGFVGDGTGYIAPMQGFFVKAKTAKGKTLKLKYTSDMMADAADIEAASAGIRTRGAASTPKLTVSALNDGKVSSAAVLLFDHEGCDMPVLDNSELEVRSTVYTVSDGKALSVNGMSEDGKVELGLIALPEETTVLRFSFEDGSEDVMLYDSATEEYTPVYDGMEYTLNGNTSGRLFLTKIKDLEADSDAGISWSVAGEEVTVRCQGGSEAGLSVKVYDYAGRAVIVRSVEADEMSFHLDKGVYILEAESGAERICKQVKI